MANKRSEFDKWFAEQFGGGLPLSHDTITNLRNTISERKEEMVRAELFLQEQETLVAQYRAALYAWQAAVTK